MSLSVAIITKNEEANLRRTLESVKWADEIVVVDSGSTDRTCEIAREYGAKVFVEEWKGFAKQKNSALEKCTKEWILSLDADEEVSDELAEKISQILKIAPVVQEQMSVMDEGKPGFDESLDRIELVMALEESFQVDVGEGLYGFRIPRKNIFLGKWIRYGGFYPDDKVRLIRQGCGGYQDRPVHETIILKGAAGWVKAALIHHAYPTLSGYIEHMNRYSDLAAEMALGKNRPVGFSFINIVIRPIATFIYNYFLRLGFLDGREGLLLHLYHSVYVSWKYAKAWELSSSGGRQQKK